MNIKKKLLNPFALVGQGFLAGAILFYSTVSERPDAQPLSAGVRPAAAPQIAGI